MYTNSAHRIFKITEITATCSHNVLH